MLKERKSLCQLIEVTDKQLHEMNYSQAVIYSYRRCWRELIEYAEERNVTYYSVELGEKYLLEKRGIDIYADKKTLNLPRWKINPFMRAINVLTDMQNIGVIRKIYHVDRIKLPENYSNIAEQFCSKCRQRYNSERTIIAKDFAVKRFLNHLIQTNILSIDSITSKDITSYLKTTISWSQRTVALAICNLKQFLSFLYEEKYIKTDISLWIPTANHGRAATLPNIWTQDDIERLLSSVDRANPIGKRDYAILLLVARLGLRDSDVQNLTFSNILWKECRISLVQTKTKRALDLPITEEIGNAIISSVLGIVAAVASIITSGYSVSVVKKAIVKSDEIPDLDLRENIIDGLKMIVMLIVYYIIPIIITLIVAFATGFFNQYIEVATYASQYGSNFVNMVSEDLMMSLVSSAAITIIIGIILLVIFSLLFYMGICRLAKYNSLSEGADIPEAARDLKRIGIGKVIGWMILLFVIIAILTFIETFISSIPSVGILISAFLISTYNLFIAYRSVGLLYSAIE